MSFYRQLAAVAAIVLLAPAFADSAVLKTARTAIVQPARVAQAKINLNTATGKELVKIKGLTPGKARAIVTFRKRHGNFTSVDEVIKVKSVSKLKPEEVKQIKDQLTI